MWRNLRRFRHMGRKPYRLCHIGCADSATWESHIGRATLVVSHRLLYVRIITERCYLEDVISRSREACVSANPSCSELDLSELELKDFFLTIVGCTLYSSRTSRLRGCVAKISSQRLEFACMYPVQQLGL